MDEGWKAAILGTMIYAIVFGVLIWWYFAMLAE